MASTALLKIFDGKTYAIRQRVALEKDADSIGFDTKTRLLCVVSGARTQATSSSLTVIDMTAEKKVANLEIEGDTLEAMAPGHFSVASVSQQSR
jgi:hypothetical protein